MKVALLLCIFCLLSKPLLAKPSANTVEEHTEVPIENTNLSWLKLSRNVQQSWQVKAYAEKDNWLYISPKNKEISSKLYKIMAVISKKTR